MKKLYIIRHGNSNWDEHIQKDFDRLLSDKGRDEALKTGFHLKENYLQPELIVSSPATRAISTARIIAHEAQYNLEKIQEEKEIYNASLHALLEIIENLPNDKNTVYLFGHNPGLSQLASYLTEEPIQMDTCNVAVLTTEVDSWKAAYQGTCTLESYLTPEELG